MPSDASDRILGWLRAASGPVSGEELASRLAMSRAAVFKHVEALRARGYRIDAEHAQGYVLAGVPDRLDAAELGPRLTGTWRRIVWYAETDSTQQRARELAREGAEEGTIVVAEAQTAGRGRLGRTWHSPPGANLYCSILLRPALPPASVPQLALVAGLAVARAIETLGLRPTLKWPNDVLLDGRKVTGVLTEMEAEVERVHVVVVGIGVNLNTTADQLPEYLRDKATSLAVALGRPVDRGAFTASLLSALEDDYRTFLHAGFARLREPYERRAALTGRQVRIAGAGSDLAGRVAGIDDDGALRLVDANGETHHIVAGEVTIAGGYDAP
jgi:BirA family biotin operon repressor/biotin-[acetyl-CoA-carboxylase] ligase